MRQCASTGVTVAHNDVLEPCARLCCIHQHQDRRACEAETWHWFFLLSRHFRAHDRVLGVRGTPKPVSKTMPPGRKMDTRRRDLGAGRPRPVPEGCVIFDLGIQGRSGDLMLDT